MTDWTVRAYNPADETSWLRCRVLSFLDTSYFDDVATAKPHRDAGLELVAVADDHVIGLLDASITGTESTIETLAVHPDHRRLGIAQRLLNEICDRLQQRGATQVDAWTRDDEGTLAWYHSQGFEQAMRYLHVYASTPAEALAAFGSPTNLMPRAGFFHAWPDQEDALRNQYTRVHSCRQLIKLLKAIDMRYVRVEFTMDGTYSDPRTYLQQLSTLAASLPAGARAFATDPEHYNYYGQRCVKDLKPQSLTSGEDNGTSWLELLLRHNCWKHDEDLTIRYSGVDSLTMDPAGNDLDVAHLQDVILDEILPEEHGCRHEIGCLSGSLTITCEDLVATWIDSGCPEQNPSHSAPQ